jgi:hypothetical protein
VSKAKQSLIIGRQVESSFLARTGQDKKRRQSEYGIKEHEKTARVTEEERKEEGSYTFFAQGGRRRHEAMATGTSHRSPSPSLGLES